MNIPKPLLGIWDKLTDLFAAIHWPRTQAVINGGVYYSLTEADHDAIRDLLRTNYYIILTRRRSHLTTYLIALASAIVDRKFSHYTHALMNVEGDITGHLGYKLIEATGKGVHFSTFMEVFDCDSVALLSPKGLTPDEWTKIMDTVKSHLGKPYDDLFDIMSDNNLSCVEMVYWGLKSLPDYENRFPKLVAMINDRKNNLTPQMLYDTGELDIAFEVRR
jgi:Permuted papain-like amidase enzyme, YaeF/YiiX, C92 family